MGWQTDALIHVFFNRETFDSENAIQEYIDEQKENIRLAKDTLNHLAFMTEPKKFCGEEEDPTYYIKNELEYAIETLENSSVELSNALAVLRGWKYSHAENGGAIYIPDDTSMEKMQRIAGDFICAVNPDGSNAFPDDEMNTNMWERLEESHKRYLEWQKQKEEWDKKDENDEI